MISTAPNWVGGVGVGWGIRSSVGILAALFRPLYFSLLSLLIFMRDSHFSFSSIAVILPVSKHKLLVTNLAALFGTFSLFLVEEPLLGNSKHSSHTPKWGEQAPICCLFYILKNIDKDFVSGNQEFYLP